MLLTKKKYTLLRSHAMLVVGEGSTNQRKKWVKIEEDDNTHLTNFSILNEAGEEIS